MTVVDLASIDGQRGMAQLVKLEDTMPYKDSCSPETHYWRAGDINTSIIMPNYCDEPHT